MFLSIPISFEVSPGATSYSSWSLITVWEMLYGKSELMFTKNDYYFQRMRKKRIFSFDLHY